MTTTAHAMTPDTASSKVRFNALVLSSVALVATCAVGAEPEQFWKGPVGGAWETSANWNAGVPSDTQSAVFYNAATVTVSSAATMRRFDVSKSNAGDVLVQGAGSVTGIDATVSRNRGTGSVVLDVDFQGNATTLGDGQTVTGRNVFKRNVEMYGNALAVVTNENLVGVMTFDGATVHTDAAIYAHKGSTLAIKGDSSVTAQRFSVKEDATVDFASGSILLTATGENKIFEVSNRQLLAANAGTRLETLACDGAAFDPFTSDSSAWMLHGGTLIATNADDNASGGLLAQKADFTHVVTGMGTIAVRQVYMKGAGQGGLRLDGPDLYTRRIGAGDDDNVTLEVGGGSTVGTFKGDLTLANKFTVFGPVTIDTDDFFNRTAGRTITLSNPRNCDGMLTAKGRGTVAFGSEVNQESLRITAVDSARVEFPDWAYHLGSLSFSTSSKLKVRNYCHVTGDASFTGNASAVIRNNNSDGSAAFECAALTLSDNASLVVSGKVAAASLSLTGNARFVFGAGSSFASSSGFGDGAWQIEVVVPEGFAAGTYPLVKGVEFDSAAMTHVTLSGATAGWELRLVEGAPTLYKKSDASGVEWTGDGADSNWSTVGNWNSSTFPSADSVVAFGGLDRLDPVNDSMSAVSGIVFRSSSGPFSLKGNPLTLTAKMPDVENTSADNAAVLSKSLFDQTIGNDIAFPDRAGVFADGGGAISFTGSVSAAREFVPRGDVRFGGTATFRKLLLQKSKTLQPTVLRVLEGGSVSVTGQAYQPIADGSAMVGRIAVDAGGALTVMNGDFSLRTELVNVIDGALNIRNGDDDSGRFVSCERNQNFGGSGTINCDRACSGRNAGSDTSFISIGGTLSLCMNGDWQTASYRQEGGRTYHDPNCPTRLAMSDGTTLTASKDWTYGPAADAYSTVAATITPAQRGAKMTGTVTVDTAGRTITFADPLDASSATVVKTGDGSLVVSSESSFAALNVATGTVAFTVAPTSIGDMTLGAAAVVSFPSTPAFGGRLDVSGGADGLLPPVRPSDLSWHTIATAGEVAGPGGAARWTSRRKRVEFRIVSVEGGQSLQCRFAQGLVFTIK